LAVFAAILENE